MNRARAIPVTKTLDTRKRVIPGSIRFLAMLLCIYLAAPLYDFPLLGLSLSAPLLFLITLEVEKDLGGLRPKGLGRLPMLLGLIWGGQAISLAIAQYFGNPSPNLNVGLITLLRYGYWFFVCCLSARLFLEGDMAQRAVRYFAYGCQIVALFVLAEYLLLGGLQASGWSKLTTLSQNSYGWQFSAFTPFVLHRVFASSGKARLWAALGLLGVLLAVFINASRSTWGTTAIGLALYVMMHGIASRKKRKAIQGLFVIGILLLVGFVAVTMLPEEQIERIQDRPVTVDELARDKSWQIRLLMVQKGKLLFLENPAFGVGPGQFRHEVADLVIPAVMGYASNEYFNEKSAHNSYMQLLAEGGLALALPMGFLLLWLLKSGGQAALRLARAGEGWAIPVWVSFVCFSVHFWTVAGITSTAPWFLYGFLGAVALRTRKIARTPTR